MPVRVNSLLGMKNQCLGALRLLVRLECREEQGLRIERLGRRHAMRLERFYPVKRRSPCRSIWVFFFLFLLFKRYNIHNKSKFSDNGELYEK